MASLHWTYRWFYKSFEYRVPDGPPKGLQIIANVHEPYLEPSKLIKSLTCSIFILWFQLHSNHVKKKAQTSKQTYSIFILWFQITWRHSIQNSHHLPIITDDVYLMSALKKNRQAQGLMCLPTFFSSNFDCHGYLVPYGNTFQTIRACSSDTKYLEYVLFLGRGRSIPDTQSPCQSFDQLHPTPHNCTDWVQRICKIKQSNIRFNSIVSKKNRNTKQIQNKYRFNFINSQRIIIRWTRFDL